MHVMAISRDRIIRVPDGRYRILVAHQYADNTHYSFGDWDKYFRVPSVLHAEKEAEIALAGIPYKIRNEQITKGQLMATLDELNKKGLRLSPDDKLEFCNTFF